MNPKDPFSELMAKWQPESPHSSAKFVNDTMRTIRLLDGRPWWQAWANSYFERLDGLVMEWLPSPRVLVPIAAGLVLFVTAIQWAKVGSSAGQLAALKWQQGVSQMGKPASLSGTYANLVGE